MRPDDNLTGAYARNSSHKDSVIFVRFFISEKHRLFFYALSEFSLRVFYIAGILIDEKTFGGDAEISRHIDTRRVLYAKKFNRNQ